MSLTDSQYLESTDINFFSCHILGLTSQSKPENVNEFLHKYFLRLQACQHVIGSDFSFINGCNYNRRSFIFCISEVLSNYSVVDDFTAGEFQQVLEQLCPDFPPAIIQDSVRILEPRTSSRQPKYSLRDLLLSFSFHFVFIDWLREVDRFFLSETTDVTRGISVMKLRQFLGDFHSSWVSIKQPPLSITDSLLTGLSNSDVGKDEFKKLVFECPYVVVLLHKIKFMAPPLSVTASTGATLSATAATGAGAEVPILATDSSEST